MDYDYSNQFYKPTDVVLIFKKNLLGNEYIFERAAACRLEKKNTTKFGINISKNYYYYYGQFYSDNEAVINITDKNVEDLFDPGMESTPSIGLSFDSSFANDNDPDILLVKIPDSIKKIAYDDLPDDYKTIPNNKMYLTKLSVLGFKLGYNMNGILLTKSKELKCNVDSKPRIMTTKCSDEAWNFALKESFGIVPIEKKPLEMNATPTKKSPEQVKKENKNSLEKTNPTNTISSNNGNKSLPKQYDVASLIDEIKKSVIEQDNAVEDIVTSVVINQQIVDSGEDVPTSSILVDGPTGTGKTFIIQNLTKKLGIPYVINNATGFSTTGYKGANLTDVLCTLLEKTNGNLELAQRSIVVFDEFDKLGKNLNASGDDLRKGFQDELLTFMEGQQYNVSYNNNIYTFDTSKLTFVALGAFTDLRENKIKSNEGRARGSLGFSSDTPEEIKREYVITPQDYVDAGIKREIVGRLSCITYTNEFNRDMLKRILIEGKDSALNDLIKIGKINGKQVVVDDEVIDEIVELAYKMNTGARGLRQVCESLKNVVAKDILISKGEVVRISLDTLEKAKRKTVRSYNIDSGRRI